MRRREMLIVSDGQERLEYGRKAEKSSCKVQNKSETYRCQLLSRLCKQNFSSCFESHRFSVGAPACQSGCTDLGVQQVLV